MTLLWPAALPLLATIPVAALVFWGFERARARRIARVVGPRAAALAPGSATRDRRWRGALMLLALLFALLAILQPAWGASARAAKRQGADVLICLDVSRSMLARDLDPSRLGRAQAEIAALAERAIGDRFGLVLFAGEAVLAVPLTRDRASFVELARAATPLSVRQGGTDLGAALAEAQRVLAGRAGKHAVVLLLTDGEDHEERGLRAARACRDRGITVHCVGLGTALGAKIPVGGGFLRDRSGREVVSAMRSATLRPIAEATGGDFVDAGAHPRPLLDLYEHRIEPMARETFEAGERRSRENRYQLPLAGALLLWGLHLCVGGRRR